MIISTKGRYGLRALIDIAIYSSSEIVTLKSISERQRISERYLEQIFSSLRKGGVVKAKKGPQGGYYLEEEAYDLTMGDILRILEGDLSIVDMEKEENQLENFLWENLWNMANIKMNNYFDAITLKDLVEKYRSSKENIMYYI